MAKSRMSFLDESWGGGMLKGRNAAGYFGNRSGAPFFSNDLILKPDGIGAVVDLRW
jgi:hypothetical protein